MRPLNILVVTGWIHPDAEGGSFRVAYELARGLAGRGHQIHVVTQQVAPSSPAEEVFEGLSVHRYATTAASGLGFYRSTIRGVRKLLPRLVEQTRFDAIHYHHLVSALATNLCAATSAIPRLFTFHIAYFLEYLDKATFGKAGPSVATRAIAHTLRRLESYNLRRSSRVVTLSEFTREQIRAHFPSALERTHLIPGGVDVEKFQSDLTKLRARQELSLPEEARVFLTVRRLEPRMGVENLVQGFRQVADRYEKARLVVVGRGSLQSAIAAQVQGLSLQDRVLLAGYVEEATLPTYYRAADCFVLPTRALEGFGVVTTEALAGGLPVLGTPVGATPELLRPLDPRLVLEGVDSDELAAGMARFLDEISKDQALPGRCVAYARSRFSWDRIVEQYESLFAQLT